MVASFLAGACRSDQSAQEAANTLALLPEVRIQSDDARPEYLFTTIAQLVQHGDAVYVVQQGVSEIRIFGIDGTYRRTIGRAGSGPGEFQSTPVIGFLADTLWAIDADTRRLSFFAPSGNSLSTVNLPPMPLTLGQDGQLYFPYPKALVDGGWMLGFGGEAGSSLVSGKVTRRPLLRFDRSSGAPDTLAWVSLVNSNMVIRTQGRASLRDQPFGDEPLTTYGPQSRQVVIVERRAASDDTLSMVRVTAIGMSGDTAWDTSISYRPKPFDRVVVDSTLKALQRAYQPRYPPSSVEEAFFAPKFRVPVTSAIAGDDGTVWIRWDDQTAPDRITVIDSLGHLREAAVPAKVSIKWVSGGIAWGEELDENDVPTLVRYRVISSDSVAKSAS